MADEPAVDSHALGAGELIQPCGDALRPARPAPPATGPPFAVTLSGGGFRATFAALGVIRYLADAGLLSSLRYVSSVSGGSVANALLAKRWPALRAAGFATAAVDELVVEPAVRQVSGHSLKLALVANIWRAAGRATRTDVLAHEFDAWFLDKLLLEELDPEVRWIFSAANIVTGVRFTLERDVVGDYVAGLAPTAGTKLRVSQAAAASAAVPGAFAAWTLRDVAFPCATRQPVLLDGGVYDNTGLEAIDGDDYRNVFSMTLNAGGLLRPAAYGKVPLIRDLARANSLLYRQSTTLRTRAMVASFKRGAALGLDAELPPGARRGVLFALATSFPEDRASLAAWRSAFPERRSWAGKDLALYPTVFDKLPAGLCRTLVYRGWWLAGAVIATYFPALGPAADAIAPPPLPENA